MFSKVEFRVCRCQVDNKKCRRHQEEESFKEVEKKYMKFTH